MAFECVCFNKPIVAFERNDSLHIHHCKRIGDMDLSGGPYLMSKENCRPDTLFNCHPSCLHDCFHIVMMLFGSIFHRCIERTLVTIDGARAINEGAWSQRTFPVSYTGIYLVPFKWRKCEDKIPPTPKKVSLWLLLFYIAVFCHVFYLWNNMPNLLVQFWKHGWYTEVSSWWTWFALAISALDGYALKTTSYGRCSVNVLRLSAFVFYLLPRWMKTIVKFVKYLDSSSVQHS